MIKFFSHIRKNSLMENRTERKENVLKIFLVKGPDCSVGIKNYKHD
jgi:hypothetical protein